MRLLEKYLIILLTTFLVGCGGSGEGVSVSGKVTFNDEPVTNGEIFFLSESSDIQGFSGEITDGSFSANVPEGNYKVRISATRKTGEMKPGPGGPDDPQVPVMESYIPPKYNSQTELTATVES
ncbi:hypothetical protein OAK47_02735 [Planctomycetaceae bacterium]|jgi:hypothetical protein|nr:hypothetical protein [bacterium]MDC0262118.1 hypothetical protein [Planctomycetaceae bacterium]MDC0273339.1 hypothetical protein [Planctomycetaceae bacterium]MDC0307942.1 hypothetical protein [Planctomycetaceae bacterium]MDG2391853.1 hypothetical protein [Planctomycetaceae bacterium]